MSIRVFVPSRGRPDRAALTVQTIRDTAPDVKVVVAIDPDDDVAAYVAAVGPHLLVLKDRVGYTGTLNLLAEMYWDHDTILGAFGDDVLFRTPRWDSLVEEALSAPGIAYGNDLVHAKGHPTAIFMHSVLAKALGYLAIPQSRHLWVDDAWKELGQRTDTLRYIPEAIFEHMHPAVGKAEMDQTYHEVYDGVLGHQDHLGFQEWQKYHADDDVAKIRVALNIWAGRRPGKYDYAQNRAE